VDALTECRMVTYVCTRTSTSKQSATTFLLLLRAFVICTAKSHSCVFLWMPATLRIGPGRAGPRFGQIQITQSSLSGPISTLETDDQSGGRTEGPLRPRFVGGRLTDWLPAAATSADRPRNKHAPRGRTERMNRRSVGWER
jgi:hypothetical protein